MCGAPACSLELPTLEPAAAAMFGPFLKLAALKIGIRLDPSATSNPLAAIPGDELSKLLAVKCPTCASSSRALLVEKIA